MQVKIAGKNLSVGRALSDYVEATLDAAVGKYFDRAIDADVVFFKEAHLFCADIIVNEGTGTGITIRGQAKENDIYAAFDSAAERIEKQLRRYKRKLKNHHKVPLSDLPLAARKYVISNEGQEEETPLIIAEKPIHIESLAVSDAVMHMNLGSLPALMFINKKTGKVNLVYHRADGNISWVESDIVTGEVKISASGKSAAPEKKQATKSGASAKAKPAAKPAKAKKKRAA